MMKSGGRALKCHKAPYSEGSRTVFLAKCVFGGLGYHGQETTPFQGGSFFAGLAAFGGKAQTQQVPEHVWFCGLLYPRPPTNHLYKKPVRDPSDL